MSELREEGLDEDDDEDADGADEQKGDDDDAEMTPVHPGHPAVDATVATEDEEGDTQVVEHYEGKDDTDDQDLDALLEQQQQQQQQQQEAEAPQEQEPEPQPPLFVPPVDVFATQAAQTDALSRYISDPKQYLQRWRDVRVAFAMIRVVQEKGGSSTYSDEAMFSFLFSALASLLDPKALLNPDVFTIMAKTTDDVLSLLSSMTLVMRHVQPVDLRRLLLATGRNCKIIDDAWARSASVPVSTESIEREKSDRALLFTPNTKGVLGAAVISPLLYKTADIMKPAPAQSYAALPAATAAQLVETLKLMPDSTGSSPVHMLAMCMHESLFGKAHAVVRHPLSDAMRCNAILVEAKTSNFEEHFKASFESLLDDWPASTTTTETKGGTDYRNMECLADCLDLCTMYGAFPWRARFPQPETLVVKCLDVLVRMSDPVFTFDEITALRAASSALRLAFVELEPSRYREYDNVPELVRDKHKDKDLLDEIKDDEKTGMEQAALKMKELQSLFERPPYLQVPRFILYLATAGTIYSSEFGKLAPMPRLSFSEKPNAATLTTALLRVQLTATVLAVLQPHAVSPSPLWLRWPFAGQMLNI